MPALGELNERVTSIEEVREALNEMKSGKTPRLKGCQVGCLKKGGKKDENTSFDVGSIYELDW